MKRFRVTKLKLTDAAASDLQRLRLTRGDLDLVLSLGKKLDCTNLRLKVFEAAMFPPHKRLFRLDGIILVIHSNEIVAVWKDLFELIEWSKHHD